MSAELSKPALRAELRAARDGFVLGLAPGERARLECRAAGHLMARLGGAQRVAFYWGMGAEIGCEIAISLTENMKISTCLPYVEDRHSVMRFLRWIPGDRLEPGWRGLLQPAADAPEIEPDLIVTPLLGFDSRLMRLGQGAGFYDRAFAARPGVGKIGLGWSIQSRPVIAADPWDVPLDAVVTEAGVIERA